MDLDELFGVFNEKPKPTPPKEDAKASKPPSKKQGGGEQPEPKTYAVKRTAEETFAEDRHVELERHKLAKQADAPLRLSDAYMKSVDPFAATVIRNEVSDNCVHEVALPPNYTGYIPLSETQMPATPAKEYKFTLDPFQREAVKCLERNESVLVSAHTSAGKTVVAEYAIAKSLKGNQRVIYTTPIKALSNQKYRELLEEFGDVGLMTGDVTINPEGSCLVMTTEILRSMLYRGSEVMREVAWVVFDEVHYMRDKERGVVWEETLILLPDNVHYVFLSATIPNALQFAKWICYIHSQPCHVVYTDYRPTPLQHYIYPAGADGLHLVVDERGNFREDNFAKAMLSLTDSASNTASANKAPGRDKKGMKGNSSNVFKIVKMIMEKHYEPVIVFSFSKRECEAHAMLMSKLDFNSEDEKSMIEEVFGNAIASLSDDDKHLPQVEHVLPLLKRGIGIHHSGLLPLLKEVIEILFGEGLVKVLFATETFAMGLNMPARTVVFTNVRKFDGKDFRWLTSGEYIQMSGRAGRRGLDDRGIVILMVDEKMEPAVGKALLKGNADQLNSAFHLTYNMVLNLLRVEDITPEYMIERSFFQFQNNSAIPELEALLAKTTKERDSIAVPNEEMVEDYYMVQQQLADLSAQLQRTINDPKYCVPFLQAGRLVKVKDQQHSWGWGCVVNFQKDAAKKKGDDQVIRVDVLLKCKKGSSSKEAPLPCAAGETGEMMVLPVLLGSFERISSVRIFMPEDIRSKDVRQGLAKSIDEVARRFPDGIPALDPIEDMKIKGDDLSVTVKRMEALEQKMKTHPLKEEADIQSRIELYTRKHELNEKVALMKKQVKQSKSIQQLDELKCRKRVLRRLAFCTSDDVIELKGRTACEVSTGDELLLTEMMFNGVFNELAVNQVVSLLSCFVFEEKAEDKGKLREELAAPLRQMQDTARRIAKVCVECKIALDEEEYVQSFKSSLMDVVHAWCTGAKFADICKMTDVFEGSIIRAMRRLEELLREMSLAAKAIGNTELENKFAEGITRIKRDIVFAASLYL